MASLGKNAKGVSDMSIGILILTLTVYSVAVFKLFFLCWPRNCCLDKILGILLVLEFLPFIPLIVVYCYALNYLNNIDYQLLKYVVDNNCSD